MRRLLALFLVLQSVRCSCPSGFELVSNGQCRGKYAVVSGVHFSDGVDLAIKKCKEIKGQPVIIHNDEQQEYWAARAPKLTSNYNYLITGLVCNEKTERWEWADGSRLDYRPKAGYDDELNAGCSTGLTWTVNPPDGFWNYGEGSSGTFTAYIYCTTQLQQPTGDDCESFNDDVGDGMCYQIRANAQSWQDAQTTCRNLGATVASIHNFQENTFIRRSAVAQGAVNGMYIGAISTGIGNQYRWIDGSPWDYQYFSPGFPVAGHGDCLAMDTFSGTGQWMNMDCSSKLAVACAKKAEPRHTCTAGPWKEGQIIYSPGYPYDASVPCDYYISVAAGKKVRVDVLLLEANTCCDRLVMEDDVLGGNIVANLTGEITDQFYTTKSSNFMRVSWQPKGGFNVRGMMFSFTGV